MGTLSPSLMGEIIANNHATDAPSSPSSVLSIYSIIMVAFMTGCSITGTVFGFVNEKA